MTTRDLVFSVWATSGQDQTRTVAALLDLAAGRFETIKRGGAVLISSNIGGSTFSFQLPAGVDGLSIIALIRQAWLEIKDLSAGNFTSYLAGNTSNSIVPTWEASVQ